MDSIPAQLAKENKKFRYSQVEKKTNVGAKRYATSLAWLEKSGLVNYCYNLSEVKMPLNERIRLNSFKAYLFDTGVLVNMMEPGTASEIVSRSIGANNGAIVENVVACALHGKGYPLRYYQKEDSSLGVDFIINLDGKLIGVEAKSGRKKKSTSLRILYKERKSVSHAVKLAEGNIFRDETGVYHYPLFAPFFFREPNSGNIFGEDDFSELNDRFNQILTKRNDAINPAP